MNGDKGMTVLRDTEAREQLGYKAGNKDEQKGVRLRIRGGEDISRCCNTLSMFSLQRCLTGCTNTDGYCTSPHPYLVLRRACFHHHSSQINHIPVPLFIQTAQSLLDLLGAFLLTWVLHYLQRAAHSPPCLSQNEVLVRESASLIVASSHS